MVNSNVTSIEELEDAKNAPTLSHAFLSELVKSSWFRRLVTWAVVSEMTVECHVSISSVQAAVDGAIATHDRARTPPVAASTSQFLDELLRKAEVELFQTTGIIANLASRLQFLEDRRNSSTVERGEEVSRTLMLLLQC